jgi:hypothetical protein
LSLSKANYRQALPAMTRTYSGARDHRWFAAHPYWQRVPEVGEYELADEYRLAGLAARADHDAHDCESWCIFCREEAEPTLGFDSPLCIEGSVDVRCLTSSLI